MACCLGDTFASEIGILSKSTPRLATTWKKVPPGTNGGMTLLGTLASVLGGALIGAALGFELFLEGGTCLTAHDWEYSKLVEYGRLVVYGAAAGALGSYVRALNLSIVGASWLQVSLIRLIRCSERLFRGRDIIRKRSKSCLTSLRIWAQTSLSLADSRF